MRCSRQGAEQHNAPGWNRRRRHCEPATAPASLQIGSRKVSDTRLPSNDDLNRKFTELRQILHDLECGFRVTSHSTSGGSGTRSAPPMIDLLRTLGAARTDGYRTSTRPMAGTPSTVYDEEGHAMPPRSDPTGETAISESRVTDPMRVQLDSAWRGVTGALGDLRMSRNAIIRASEGVEEDAGEPGCECHAEIGVFMEVHVGTRCRWCWNFWRVEGTNPPPDLLRMKDRGVRITQRMVAEALRPRKVKAKSRR